MNTYKETFEIAGEALDRAGFDRNPLSRMNLPDTVSVEHGDERVPFSVHGNADARVIVPHATPYLTFLDPHFQLRLAAKQDVLGDEYCVVGIGAYDPRDLPFNREQREQASGGDFRPLSERVLRVVDSLRLNDGQSLLFDGQSLAGDIAVQTTHDMYFDDNRGIANVAGLSATECARMANRGARGVSKAMAASGDRLVDNIVGSHVPSLLEAWNIDPEADPEATRKSVMGDVNKGAVKYLLSSPLGNLALIRGFGTDKSKRQIIDILNLTSMPAMITRSRDSTVFPEEAMEELEAHVRDGVILHTEQNDHSSDDNIRNSAARILHFALSLPEAN